MKPAERINNLHPALLNAIKLGIFAIVAALILGSTYSGTAERIAEAQLIIEQRALLEVVERLTSKNIDLQDRIAIPEEALELLHLQPGQSIQVVRNNQSEAIAFILPSVAPNGYSGAIRMLIGLDLDGQITGIRVVDHRETPGLGDKVDIKKSSWIEGFAGKSLGNPEESGWAVKKDGGSFDAFTGATITPRAVVSQVRTTLAFYQQHLDEFIAQATTLSVEESE